MNPSFVCAMSHETKNIVRLRDYTHDGTRDTKTTVLKAAMATSAATTFFEPVFIGKRKFVDAALSQNNPVNQVEWEAADIWCPDTGTGDLMTQTKCFISVGTGNPGIKAVKKGVLKFLSETLSELATETEKTAEIFSAQWRQHLDERRYFRFNVEQGLQGTNLAEHTAIGDIEAKTAAYLVGQVQKFKVRDCVTNLQQKRSVCLANYA